MRPWAWVAAFAAVCLVLASSTALYAINSGVRLGLPWWTAVVAPALVYALVLPLCVPRIRLGGWLTGFFSLVLLHVLLGLATAWLYAQVGLTSFEEALAPAFFGFPPALVLAMVGALLMTIPLLGALAPPQAGARSRPESVPIAEFAPKRIAQEPPPVPAQARQTWARPETARVPVVEPVVAPRVEPVVAAAPLPVEPVVERVPTPIPPPVTAAVAPPIEEPPAAPTERPTVHAAPLSGTNGSVSEAEEPAPETTPNFRQALSELLGAPSTRDHGEEPHEAPEVVEREVPPLEIAETSRSAAAEPIVPVMTTPPTAPVVVPERREPSHQPETVRIPFERVVGQLPPGAFRVPLAQVGARLREPGVLLVPQALILSQLGEGVVQVAWDAVAEQFPATVFAGSPAAVKERIVNGRLLLPLDEIVRQLPPDVFGASMARGTVSIPGIENFPAPFKPVGYSEPAPAVPAPAAEPARSVEPLTVETPRVVAAAPPGEMPSVARAVPVADLPVEPEPIVIEEVPRIEEVPVALIEPAPSSAEDAAPVVVVAPNAEPFITEATSLQPAETDTAAVVRIPFERVMGQLPPGAFRVPLAQVGARLEEPHVLRVARDLVVPQLAEGAVLVAWEVVASQFPVAVLAVAPAEVKSRIENGQLVLPLDEIVKQLPSEVFGAAMRRGPVHVPGIEGFPAPFKPREEPESATAPLEPARAGSLTDTESPATVASPPTEPITASEPVSVTEPVRTSEPSPVPDLVSELEPLPAPEVVRASEPIAPPEPVGVAEPVRTPEPLQAPEPLPVPVAPLFDAGAFERPLLSEPPAAQSERPSDAERLAPLLVRLETATMEEVRVGDRTIVSVSTAGMPGSAVAAAAGRLSQHVGHGAPAPIEQATFRGAGGMLVLTPIGSGWSSGTTLAIGTRSGGALARLEMLARRAARDHEVGPMDAPVRDALPFTRLDAVDAPPSMAAVAMDLTAFGPLAAQSYREGSSGAVVHCLVAPNVSAAELAPFAWHLAQAMMQSSPADAFGAFHSAVLRSGNMRVEVRRLSSRAGLALVLAVGGIDAGRPGLARLQIERAAVRLGAA